MGHLPRASEWGRLSSAWTARIDAEIEALTRLKRALADCIGCGCLSLALCHNLNPRDRMAARGAGPLFWTADEPEE